MAQCGPMPDRQYGTSAVAAACLSAKSSSDETSGVSPPTGSISGFKNVHCLSALLTTLSGSRNIVFRSLGTMLSTKPRQLLNSRGQASIYHWPAMVPSAAEEQGPLHDIIMHWPSSYNAPSSPLLNSILSVHS